MRCKSGIKTQSGSKRTDTLSHCRIITTKSITVIILPCRYFWDFLLWDKIIDKGRSEVTADFYGVFWNDVRIFNGGFLRAILEGSANFFKVFFLKIFES